MFLALWYIAKFPFALGATGGEAPRDVFYRILCHSATVEEIMVRAFVVGSMLANKANDDHCLCVREW